MSLLVRRCLNRTHLLEQLVETWQIDHKEAMHARDLEEPLGKRGRVEGCNSSHGFNL